MERSRFILCLLIGLLWVPGLYPQTAEEHASHHPVQAGTTIPAIVPATTGGVPAIAGATPAAGGGMMDAMGKMMESMGKAPAKELYPTLMSIPILTPEEREKVRGRAYERMHSGVALMSTGLGQLGDAAEHQDYAAMQKATADVREALARFESGLAARRALAEGKPPQQIALQWFKSEMNLQPPQKVEARGGLFGLSVFHWIIMATLAVFALVMIWMYFHKMQRATALLQNLTSGAPPLAIAGAPAGGTPPAAQTVEDAKPAPSFAPIVAAVPATADAKAVPLLVPTGKWSGKLRLSQIFNETPNVKTFRLMDPMGGDIPFNFLPGQYLTVTVLPEGMPVRRSYTIASSPTEHGYVDLTIKREEKGVESRYLHDRVQAGDLLDFTGPSGCFVFTGHECKCLVFIAAGVGITPLMCVTRYLTDKCWPGEIFLLYSCHSPQDYIFKEELEFLQRRHPNLHVVVTASKAEGTDWTGPTGRITKELIAKSVPGITSRRVHICGPKEMMEATEKFLGELGVPKEQVKTEAFGPAIGKPEAEPKPADKTTATPNATAASPAVTPAAPPAPVSPVVGAVTVTFSRSAKTSPLTPEKSVLEASEEIGVNIPFECRMGTCGVCKTKLVSGQVTMAVEDALTPEDKAAGMILACQAKSTGNVVVEA